MLLGACASLLLMTLAPGALSQELPTLSGRWQAEPLTVRWVIGQWGDACGPRPSGGGDPGGPVTIQQGPDELTISGGERSYSTAECWQMHPGLARGSHTGGRRAWSSACRTPDGDSRQEVLHTTVTATDDTISLQESGQYHFVVAGQTCSASSGRWRTYRLLQREGEPERTPPPVNPTPQVPTPQQPTAVPARPEARPTPSPSQNPCAKPGPPAQIEVRPAIKLLRPGEEFTFHARVLDARGCSSAVPVAWRLEGDDSIAELELGRLRVRAGVKDAELGVVASAAQQAVRADVQVVSNERYSALLESGGFNADGALDAAAVAIISTGSIGMQPVQSEAVSDTRKWAFVGIVGLAAVLLGLLGAVLLSLANRGRAKAAVARPEQNLGQDTFGFDAAPDAPAPPFGSSDATRLDPLSAGVPQPGGGSRQPSRVAQPSAMAQPSAPPNASAPPPRLRTLVCPVCGTLYTEPQISSCPRDGAELLPVNAPRPP